MKAFVCSMVMMMVMCAGKPCLAQDQNSMIKTQAMDMARSLLKKDYQTFSRYMHPKMMEMAGGKNKLINRMDTMNAVAAQFGAEISKILIGNPGNIIHYKAEWQVTVPQTTEMTSAFGNITLESTLIAISDDKGKNWYFIDTSVYSVKDIKKAMPDLSPDLVIPPVKMPKITPNRQ